MKIGLLRESGGLGDVIMSGGVVQRFPEDEVVFIGFEEYRQAIEHIGYSGACYLDPRARKTRRNRLDILRLDKPFISHINGFGFDRIYDLFCPGYIHEFAVRNERERVVYNRVEAMQIQCGFYNNFKRPIWKVKDEEIAKAYIWLELNNIKECNNLVPIHYRATSASRSYLKIRELIDILIGNGYTVLLLDSINIIDKFKKCGVITCWKEPLWLKAAILKIINKLICVDSGFLHLAASIGVKTLSLWGPTDPVITTKLYSDDVSIYCYDLQNTFDLPNIKFDTVKCETPPCMLPPKQCNNIGCKWMNEICVGDIVEKFGNFV